MFFNLTHTYSFYFIICFTKSLKPKFVNHCYETLVYSFLVFCERNNSLTIKRYDISVGIYITSFLTSYYDDTSGQ